MTDTILTTFIEQTRADPALARDLLEATEWNLEAAVTAYHGLYNTQAVKPEEYQYDPKDFEALADIPEDVDSISTQGLEDSVIDTGKVVSNPIVDDNEAQRRELIKHQRQKRGRGLSFLASEVVDKFNKVAVSTEKVSAKEQVTFDEKFFHHSFVYPDFSEESSALQEFIAADLIEVSMKRALERLGRLNWWTRTGMLPSLEPLATSGDGNCLLHAASLYMWGFHDRELILRTALHRILTTGLAREGLKRRWQYNTQQRYNEIGLQFSDEEWDFEWGDVIRIATNQPRQEPTTASLKRKNSLKFSYESLEEIHVFALAHVLRRAIIVISDRTIKNLSGEDLAPIYFGGIYLPFEINPTACHKSPIVLGYDSSHFAPLVAKEDKKMEEQRQRGRFAKVSGRKDTVVPLVTPDGSLLPVQFVYDPKKKLVQEKWARSGFIPGDFPDDIIRLLEAYLDVRWIQLKVDSVTGSVETQSGTVQESESSFPIKVPKVRFPAAHIKQQAQPIYQKELIEKYLKHIQDHYEEQQTLQAKRLEEKKQREDNAPVPCATEGCDMFGKKVTNNLCSVCYKANQLRQEDMEELTNSTESEDKEFYDPKTLTTTTTNNVDLKTVRGGNPSQAPPPAYQWPVDNEPEDRAVPKQAGPSPSKQSAPRPPTMQREPLSSPQASPSKTTTPATQANNSPSRTAAVTTQSNNGPSRSSNTIPQTIPLQSQKVPQTQASSSKSTKPQTEVPPQRIPTASFTDVSSSSKSTAVSKTNTSKDGWAKKVKIIPSSPSKKPQVNRGYSRDGIQPIRIGGGAESSRVICKNAGCEFFGSEDRQGYCSKCFSTLSKTSQEV